MKRHFLVCLPTLSNQDRELHKEAVLTAHERAKSRVLLFAAVSGFTVTCSCGDIERMEQITNCKTDRKLAKITALTAALIVSGIFQAKKIVYSILKGKDSLLFYVIYDDK